MLRWNKPVSLLQQCASKNTLYHVACLFLNGEKWHIIYSCAFMVRNWKEKVLIIFTEIVSWYRHTRFKTCNFAVICKFLQKWIWRQSVSDTVHKVAKKISLFVYRQAICVDLYLQLLHFSHHYTGSGSSIIMTLGWRW